MLAFHVASTLFLTLPALTSVPRPNCLRGSASSGRTLDCLGSQNGPKRPFLQKIQRPPPLDFFQFLAKIGGHFYTCWPGFSPIFLRSGPFCSLTSGILLIFVRITLGSHSFCSGQWVTAAPVDLPQVRRALHAQHARQVGQVHLHLVCSHQSRQLHHSNCSASATLPLPMSSLYSTAIVMRAERAKIANWQDQSTKTFPKTGNLFTLAFWHSPKQGMSGLFWALGTTFRCSTEKSKRREKTRHRRI